MTHAHVASASTQSDSSQHLLPGTPQRAPRNTSRDLQGWCPPVPILRRLGKRTQTEIDEERYALKALRGDFAPVSRAPGDHAFEDNAFEDNAFEDNAFEDRAFEDRVQKAIEAVRSRA